MPTRQILCPNCAAPMVSDVAAGGITTCRFCGATFQVHVKDTDELRHGSLLLSADFAAAEAPGWSLSYPDMVTYKPGELWMTHPASELIHPVLRTPGRYDDVDVSVTIRFIDGSYDHIHAGMEVRSGDEGDYVISISPQGTYRVGWHNKNEWGGNIVPWTTHPELRTGMGLPNRLRVVMYGDRLRVYLNDILASSLRDTKLTSGAVRLVMLPSKHGPSTVAFARIELREVM
ncbi:MAG: hypothetical protein ACT4QE_00350 [Anaerolineales bacterium]